MAQQQQQQQVPASFDVNAWLQHHPGKQCRGVPVQQPRVVGCWTKAADGSGGGYAHRPGDWSGLAAYSPPPLPLCLDSHGAPPFVPKPEDSVGVEAVLRAAAAGGAGAALLARRGDAPLVVTFRNNLSEQGGGGACPALGLCPACPALSLSCIELWPQSPPAPAPNHRQAAGRAV